MPDGSVELTVTLSFFFSFQSVVQNFRRRNVKALLNVLHIEVVNKK